MISKRRGAAILPREYLIRSASNNAAFFLLGRRYDLDDPRRKDMDDNMEHFLLDRAASTVDYRPAWLKALARRLFPRSLSVAMQDTVRKFEAMTKWV
ncbi:hypothetical protein HPB48_014789 [Haemaphysalis longicornis]|uniref:Uncharacterized protein n=1 Tax=Haemaphysalis longicornis TaxID=44386 RepID=A0A9J6G5F6_HAELO|nr:hypothetical protein HPB48_014789 [Haemaphysalis longicornis]